MTIALRKDYDSRRLKIVAMRTLDLVHRRRLKAIAAIYAGASRNDAAEVGGVTRQIVRDWVVRFNSSGPRGLASRRGGGRPSILGNQRREWLAKAMANGSIPELGVVVPWNFDELRDRIETEWRMKIARRTLRRELKRLGITKTSSVRCYRAFSVAGMTMPLKTFNRAFEPARGLFESDLAQ